MVDITLARLFFLCVLFYFLHFHFLFLLFQCLNITLKEMCTVLRFDLFSFYYIYATIVFSPLLFGCSPPVFCPFSYFFILFVSCIWLPSVPLFYSQATRSQAACPDLSVPANVLAWRQWCAAVTSTSTHCLKASPETWLNCEFLGINNASCIYVLSV